MHSIDKPSFRLLARFPEVISGLKAVGDEEEAFCLLVFLQKLSFLISGLPGGGEGPTERLRDGMSSWRVSDQAGYESRREASDNYRS